MKKVIFWLVVLGIVILFGMTVMSDLGSNSSVSKSQVKVDAGILKVRDTDWHSGDGKDAKLVLIEYADFQCPACGYYHPIVKKLISDFPKDLTVVYRNFPLVTIHPNAMAAAIAAEAAGRQGKFWEMHDLLFEKQSEWSSLNGTFDKFVSYAESLNLDTAKFKADLDLPELKEKVKKSLAEGEALGVDATPTFYLNGEKLENVGSYEQFKDLVQKEISKNKKP